jgi:ribosomal-protein-alanine N-acetyltransferase
MRQGDKIFCNKCGNEIQKDKIGIMPDFLEVKKEWGFFSEKDMELHQWDLCEACYDAFVKEFEIPVEIEEVMEL